MDSDEWGSELTRAIRRTMERRGTSMRGLSGETGIPYGTLQSYLLGRHAIPALAVRKLATALNVSADWLIFGVPAQLDMDALAVAVETLDELEQMVANRPSPRERARMLAHFYEGNYLGEPRRDDEGA